MDDEITQVPIFRQVLVRQSIRSVSTFWPRMICLRFPLTEMQCIRRYEPQEYDCAGHNHIGDSPRGLQQRGRGRRMEVRQRVVLSKRVPGMVYS